MKIKSAKTYRFVAAPFRPSSELWSSYSKNCPVPLDETRPYRPVRHPTQARLLETIERRPGASLRDLQEELNLNRGTATHHVRALVRRRLLVQRAQGNATLHFLSNADDRATRSWMVLLKGRCPELVRTIGTTPGLTQKEILDRVGMTRKVFGHYARLLGTHRLLHDELVNGRRVYSLRIPVSAMVEPLAWKYRHRTMTSGPALPVPVTA